MSKGDEVAKAVANRLPVPSLIFLAYFWAGIYLARFLHEIQHAYLGTVIIFVVAAFMVGLTFALIFYIHYGVKAARSKDAADATPPVS